MSLILNISMSDPLKVVENCFMVIPSKKLSLNSVYNCSTQSQESQHAPQQAKNKNNKLTTRKLN